MGLSASRNSSRASRAVDRASSRRPSAAVGERQPDQAEGEVEAVAQPAPDGHGSPRAWPPRGPSRRPCASRITSIDQDPGDPGLVPEPAGTARGSLRATGRRPRRPPRRRTNAWLYSASASAGGVAELAFDGQGLLVAGRGRPPGPAATRRSRPPRPGPSPWPRSAPAPTAWPGPPRATAGPRPGARAAARTATGRRRPPGPGPASPVSIGPPQGGADVGVLLVAAVQPLALVLAGEVGFGLLGQAEEVLGVAPADRLELAAGLELLVPELPDRLQHREPRGASAASTLRTSDLSTSEVSPSRSVEAELLGVAHRLGRLEGPARR